MASRATRLKITILSGGQADTFFFRDLVPGLWLKAAWFALWRVPQDKWTDYSARTIGLPVPEPLWLTIGVTPQILATPVVAWMVKHVEQNLPAFVKDYTLPLEPATWRSYLLRELVDTFDTDHAGYAWTEYELYWVYSRLTGLWDRYHVQGINMSAPSVWNQEEFNEWQPCLRPIGEHKFLRSIWGTVQGRLKIPGAKIWQRIRKCLGQGLVAR
jgi:Family of unknown function (DUF6492)